MIGHIMKKLVIHVSLCLLWTSTASAQSAAITLPQGKRGCTQCSPPQDQQRAQELFQEAKLFLDQGQYEEAAALYEQALTHWDNPLIRYALARALYLQDRFVEAHVHVVEVLAYGADCFDPRMWDHVQKLAVFLQEKLASMGKVEILCHDPGAQVDVGGLPGFICREPMELAQATCTSPQARVQIMNGWTITRRGEVSRFLHPGTYRLSAIKPGHDTVARPMLVTAGRTSRVAIELVVTRPEPPKRTWPRVVAWSMVGTGAVTVGVAGVVHAIEGRAKNGTFIAYGFGGTAMATGLAMLLAQDSHDAPRAPRDRSDIVVQPLITGHSAGALLGFEF